MREIKWSQWHKGGMARFGEMQIECIEKELVEAAKEARKVLTESRADHVVYAVKRYNGEGKLEEVRFYMKPMDEETFQRDVATMKNVVVYAVHKMA